MKLLCIAALFVAQSYAQLCNDLATFGDTDQDKIDRCKAFTTSEECGCTWVPGGSEGCVPDTCAPTEEPTTPSPTTGAPVTPAPVFTTTTVETTCVCPTQAAVVTTKAATTTYGKGKKAKNKSKDKNSSGNGVGDCDCDKDYGVVELRFRYQGTEDNVNIEIFYDQKTLQQVLCEFTNISPGDEIICNIASLGHDFQNETPFRVTYQSGQTCEAQYHTSCSSDIVGLVQDECTDLICTGWRDGNPNTNDCDDGVEPCECDATTAEPVITTGATEVSFVQTIVGDNCYCDATSGAFSTTSSTTTTSYKKKKKKSKGKSSDSGGQGFGDCDCDKTYGMAEMRLLYSGDEDVDIVYVHKDGPVMCRDEDIAQGEESVCNIMNNANFDKYGTNTYVKVFLAGTNNQVCMATIHTSCSSDIVGGYGDEGCGYDLLVSGWRDGNPNDDNDCDDGQEECDCEGVFVDEPEDPTEEEVVTYGDQCFCSNVNATSGITSVSQLTALTTTQSSKKKKSKRSNKNGWGFGYCDCDGGIQKLRFVYKGTEAASISLESKDGTFMCSYDGVVYGDENECGLPSSMSKFATDTHVTVTTASETCTDKIHTSCSQDIIGWTAGDCTSFVVSGWQDNKSAGECDDGFEPCDCEDVSECYFDDDENCVNQDGTEEGCVFDEGSFTCTAQVGYFSNDVELVGGVVAVVMAAMSVLAM